MADNKKQGWGNWGWKWCRRLAPGAIVAALCGLTGLGVTYYAGYALWWAGVAAAGGELTGVIAQLTSFIINYAEGRHNANLINHLALQDDVNGNGQAIVQLQNDQATMLETLNNDHALLGQLQNALVTHGAQIAHINGRLQIFLGPNFHFGANPPNAGPQNPAEAQNQNPGQNIHGQFAQPAHNPQAQNPDQNPDPELEQPHS